MRKIKMSKLFGGHMSFGDHMSLAYSYTKLFDRISWILWEDWDPIGAGVPPDEYESYVPFLFVLTVIEGTNASQLAASLNSIADQFMQVSSNKEKDMKAANLIIKAKKDFLKEAASLGRYLH